MFCKFLAGSFSAVSKRNFGSKDAFESSRRDLHNALLCTDLKWIKMINHIFLKICKNLPKFCETFQPRCAVADSVFSPAARVNLRKARVLIGWSTFKNIACSMCPRKEQLHSSVKKRNPPKLQSMLRYKKELRSYSFLEDTKGYDGIRMNTPKTVWQWTIPPRRSRRLLRNDRLCDWHR